MIAGVAVLGSAAALAQDAGFDAHGFRLASGDGDLLAPVQFVRAGDAPADRWSLGAVAEYASRPLLLEPRRGDRVDALADVIAMNVAGGFSPMDRVRIDLGVPVILTSTGAGVAAGPTAGDLRASVLVAAVRPQDADGFGLGVLAGLDAPTGDPDRYLGTVGPAGLLGLTSTLERGAVALNGMVGARIAPNTRPEDRPAPSRGGDTVEAAGSVNRTVGDRVGVGLEARVAVPVDATVRQALGIPATALASARWAFDGGGWLAAGLGTGLGRGAGASPVRLVVGGGFGGQASIELRDADDDGIGDAADACAGEPEVANGYRDEDGCPDALPQVVLVAREGEQEVPVAAITATGRDGGTRRGMGRLALEGLPGQAWSATARVGACFGATAEAVVPDEGVAEVELAIARLDAELILAVTDGAGRPLEGAVVRYVFEDEACAPADTTLEAGKAIHRVGAGPTTVFLTAPGYGVFQQTFTLQPGEKRLVDPKLAPTQVALRGEAFDLSQPIPFVGGTAKLEPGAGPLLSQVASLMMSNDALRYQVLAWSPPGGSRALAQQRAQVVVDRLVAVGVPKERLSPLGKGPAGRGQSHLVAFQVARPTE